MSHVLEYRKVSLFFGLSLQALQAVQTKIVIEKYCLERHVKNYFVYIRTNGYIHNRAPILFVTL